MPPKRDAVSDVLDAVRAIVRELRVSQRAAEQTLGVHGAQLFALQRLAEAPAHSLTDLAARTLTDPSSVSVVVSRLVERGLVTRTASPDDRRRVLIALTSAGRTVVRRAPRTAHDRILAAASRMPRRDVEALAECLGKLVAGLRSEEA